MAAILPHLAQEGETTELERRYWDCQAQGLEAPDILCPTPQQVINQSHANLMTLAWTRKVVFQQLQGVTISPKYDQEKKDSVVLVVSRMPKGPVWNPATEIGKTTLLSWTSKMSAPSFSISAGSSVIGGSCPAADAGQSIVPDHQRRKVGEKLREVLKTKIRLSDAICQYCYATKGQYPTASNQHHAFVRYAWAKRALEVDYHGKKVTRGSQKCAFVQVMIDAINHADFYIDGGKRGKDVIEPEPAQWREQRFFRLHDSGDFFDLAYLQAWKHIANHFHPANYTEDLPIIFWAPTRIWALGRKHVARVNEINAPVKGVQNLILRPSAYHVDQRGTHKLGKGWSGTTVVYRHGAGEKNLGKTFDWNCEAYSVEGGPNCRRAEGLDPNNKKKTGCRTCWMHPTSRVNYTLH